MNRIILIGNGFDLAHGLKTSYADFIKNHWDNWVKLVVKCNKNSITDGLATFTIRDKKHRWADVASEITQNQTTYEILEFIKGNDVAYEIKYTPFFEIINRAIESKKWVDVEYEYYRMLKQIVNDKTGKPYSTPIELDKEFEAIKTKLIEYLSGIQKAEIIPALVKNCIRTAIYELIQIEDISLNGKGLFEDSIENRLSEIQDTKGTCIKGLLRKYGISYLENKSDIELYLKKITDPDSLSPDWEDIYYDSEKHKHNIAKNNVPDYFLLPDQILFLNFNYTSTADLYIPKGSEFKINHIHGELNNEDNPIIFGYGDELDEDYKKISNLNDNNYLSNIKSIRYLETDNYRKLLSFIDSAPFQIYIMGHSCGNSDRTLLNTLFEHKNCVSIKPFYYEKFDEDGNRSDNYIEIIQNISRNFNDMRLMRDRVVNKTYCRPLVPKGAEQ